MTPNLPNCFYRVSIKALILDETRSKFLVGLDKEGKWCLPGGGLEWRETIEQCLEREVQEEVGMEINTIIPQAAYFYSGQTRDGDWAIDVVHEVVVKEVALGSVCECTEIRFVSAREARQLPAHKSLEHFSQVFDSAMHRAVMRSSKKNFSDE